MYLFWKLDTFLKGKAIEGEAQVDTLIRVLESGEVTVKDLIKLRNVGPKSVALLLEFLGFRQETKLTSTSSRPRRKERGDFHPVNRNGTETIPQK